MNTPATRFLVFLSVVLAIWLTEHLYVGWRLLSMPTIATPAHRRILLAVMLIGFVSYFAGRFFGHSGKPIIAAVLEYTGGLWMGLIFLLVMAFLATDIVTLGGRLFESNVIQLRFAAVVTAGVLSVLGWLGGMAPPRVVRHTIQIPNLSPEAQGLTILQVSDLHLGAFLDQRRINQVLRHAQELTPDLIAITGDLIDGDVTAVAPLIPELQRLQAPLGVIAVLGNHEYYAGAAESRELLEQSGFRVLDNRSIEVTPGLVIAGVPDDRGAAQTANVRADLQLTLSDIPTDAYKILLQHSPGDEQRAAEAGIGLMLNGHTHGGQVWPFHLMVRQAFPFLAGRREVHGMTQIVSRGAGLWGPPMRLFAPADVIFVRLEASAEDGDNDANI